MATVVGTIKHGSIIIDIKNVDDNTDGTQNTSWDTSDVGNYNEEVFFLFVYVSSQSINCLTRVWNDCTRV